MDKDMKRLSICFIFAKRPVILSIEITTQARFALFYRACNKYNASLEYAKIFSLLSPDS